MAVSLQPVLAGAMMIPVTSSRFLSAVAKAGRLLARYAFLSVGLVAYGYGIGLTVRAQAGLDPWSVLHMGVIRYLPITFGQASQVVGVLVIALAWWLGYRPTAATILNMYLVGAAYDAFDRWRWLPAPAGNVWESAGLVVLGIAATSLAAAWYMSADLGAGPRDSLFLAIVLRTGWRVSVVQWGLQALAVVGGFALGGPVGVGTVVAVLASGPCLEAWLVCFRWISRQDWSLGIVHDPVRRQVAEAEAAVPPHPAAGA